ncbi:MAG: hypothetical protein VX438_17340 [Planctomycetota bacterium]|nr:hypothetical protein [Planctomycetota bacterium]
MKLANIHKEKPRRKSAACNLILPIALLGSAAVSTSCFSLGLVLSQPHRFVGNDATKKTSSLPLARKQRKLAAFEFRQTMLQEEKRLQMKRRQLHSEKTIPRKPGSQTSYRKWRDQQEQNKRYLSRFTNNQTNDPSSVKKQLEKAIQQFNQDKPLR